MKSILALTIASIFILAAVSHGCEKEDNGTLYHVRTPDGVYIGLYRYENSGTPLLLIPGMFENHLIFDFPSKSFARFLYNKGFDVWILDLRSHDGDGDPLFDREHIEKNWDFDNTYLKKDLVTAISFVKNETGRKIVIIGHSMGGYLGYAYLEVYSDENVSALVTIGSSGVAYRTDLITKILRLPYGMKIGNRVFVSRFSPAYLDLNNNFLFRCGVRSECFHNFKTSFKISRRFILALDREPAGVVVDMMYGFDKNLKNGHWVDPQTFYDYTENLSKINVPVLLIAGSKDLSDSAENIQKTFDMIGSGNKTLYIIPDYGHVDLLLGKNVEVDVYIKIKDWLDGLNLPE